MKKRSSLLLPLLFLFATVLLWSVNTVAIRAVVYRLSPFILIFLRMTVSSVLFLPFFFHEKPWKHPQFLHLMKVSVLAAGNVILFMWGIQFTTASTSTLIYATMPLAIVFLTMLFRGKRYPSHTLFGIILGFTGIVFVVYRSYSTAHETILGSPIGNCSIILAMGSWLSYIIFSKRMSSHFSPMVIGSAASFVTTLVVFPMAMVEGLFHMPMIEPIVLLSIVFMGIGGTFFAYLLYQYAIRHLSTLGVTLAAYVQPITTTLLAVVVLKETLSFSFITGSLLVFAGLFFATTFDVIRSKFTPIL